MNADLNALVWGSLENHGVPSTRDDMSALLNKAKLLIIAWHKDNRMPCRFSQLEDDAKNAILHWPKLTTATEEQVMFVLWSLSGLI